MAVVIENLDVEVLPPPKAQENGREPSAADVLAQAAARLAERQRMDRLRVD